MNYEDKSKAKNRRRFEILALSIRIQGKQKKHGIFQADKVLSTLCNPLYKLYYIPLVLYNVNFKGNSQKQKHYILHKRQKYGSFSKLNRINRTWLLCDDVVVRVRLRYEYSRSLNL